MSIGIVTLLKDFVVLVADGMERKLAEGDVIGEKHSDSKKKVFQIGESLAIIAVGVANLTKPIIENIKYNYHLGLTINEICELVIFCADNIWKKFVENGMISINWNNPSLHTTFLLAGIFNNQTFIALIVLNHEGLKDFKIVTEAKHLMCFIGCKDQNVAYNFYEERLMQQLRELNDIDETEKRLQVLVKSGAETVRFMQERDPYIGGTIYYAIIGKDFPYIEEFFVE